MARDRDYDSVATITPLSHSYKGDKKHKKKKSKHDEERESSKHSEVKKDHHRHESQSSRNSDGKLSHKNKKDKHEEIRREGFGESRSKEHKKRKREKSRESDGREGYGSRTEAPHKKERKEYIVQVEVENNNEEPLDDSSLLQNEWTWTYEDEIKLVEMMKEQLPVNDKKSYRLTLKTIDWEAISTKLNHTAAECEEKWKEIMGFLIILKPLSTLLSEAEVELTTLKRRRLRVSKPYGRFLKDFCAKNSFKGQGIVLSKGTEAWRNLDPKIKKQYYERYYQELKEAGLKDKQTKAAGGPTPVLSAFEMFLKSFDVNDSTSKKDRRTNAKIVWKSLPVAEKVEFIGKSFEDQKRFQKEVEEYKAEHPEWTAPKVRQTTKEEISLYLEYHGMPSVPQSSPAMLLLDELGEGTVDGQESDGKKRTLASQKFKEITEGEQEMYRNKLVLLWKDYKNQLEQWKQKTDRQALEFAEKYFKEKEQPKSLTKKAVRSPKSAVSDKDEEKVETNLVNVTFIGEPPKPPSTGYRLFFTRFMRQSTLPINERMKQVGSFWEKLTEDQKDCYERKASGFKESFCKDVLKYVEGLSEEHKKMYIGTKRKTIRNFLGHDPFAADYPTSLYPLFVRSPKQKIAKSKVQNKPAVVKKKDQDVKKEDSDDSDDSSSDESKGRQDDDDDDEDSSEEESEDTKDESQSQTPVMARSSGLTQLMKHTNNQNSSDSSDSDSSSDESSDGEENEGNNDDEEQEDDGDEEEEEEEDEEEEDEKEDPPPAPPVKTPTVPKHSRMSLSTEKSFTNSISKSVSSPKTMNKSAKATANADSSSSDESDNSSEPNSSEEDSDESVDVAPAWHNQSTSAKSQEQQSQEDSESESSESD